MSKKLRGPDVPVESLSAEAPSTHPCPCGTVEVFLPGGDLLDRSPQGDHGDGTDDEIDDHVHHVHHHDDGFVLRPTDDQRVSDNYHWDGKRGSEVGMLTLLRRR